MHKKIHSILNILRLRFFLGILIFCFLIKRFPRIRNFEHIFINSRAFGHSIADSNAFLTTYQENGLCISIGCSFERNPTLLSFYPTNNLIHFILPKPNWVGKTNLRKIAGPYLTNFLKLLRKIGLMSKVKSIRSENQQVVLECLFQIATSQLRLPEKEVQKTMNFIKSVDSRAREHSKAIGSWAQIYDPKIIGNSKQENPLDKLFLKEMEKRGVDPEKLVTLILRIGKSPHHGPGLSHYLPTIEFLQDQGYSIIPLGDAVEFENYKNLDRDGVILPQSIDVEPRSIVFSSLFYSKFTLGDMSGVWPIFTMRGNRGLCLNTIPSKFLMNRVEVLPRQWVNHKGIKMTLSQQFGEFGESVRGPNREIEIHGYRPRFHDSNTILQCVRRFEKETINGTPLEIREPFRKYFAEYPQEMLTNCSIAIEIFTSI